MSTTFDMRYNAAFTEKQFKVSEVLSVWCGLRILVLLTPAVCIPVQRMC